MSTKNTIDNLLTIAPAVISDEKTRKDLIDHPEDFISRMQRDCYPQLYSFAQLLKDAYDKENKAGSAGLFALIKMMRKKWCDGSREAPNSFAAADHNVYFTGCSILKDRSKKDFKGYSIIPEDQIPEAYQHSSKSMRDIIEKHIKYADLNCTVEIEAPLPSAVVASDNDTFEIASQTFNKKYLLPILRALPRCKILVKPERGNSDLIKIYNETADAYLLPYRLSK